MQNHTDRNYNKSNSSFLKQSTSILVISLIISLSSCCGLNTEVDYQYSDVIINRIDVCGKTTFHYQNGNNKNIGKIWVKYSGINDGFSGYLVFKENGKVQLISGDGYFQSENIDTTLFEYKRIYSYNRPKNGKNVCEIQLSSRYEKEANISQETDIEITYRIDDNEWW